MLRFHRLISVVALLGAGFLGCSTPSVQVDSFRDLDANSDLAENPGAYDGLSSQLKTILEDALEEVDGDLGKQTPKHGKIPVEINNQVRKWIYYFSVKERARFRRFMRRGERLRPHIERILVENGVPKELYFLAMIESGFVTRARSHAGAVGVWQFIRATGKRYGLKQNSYMDERQDPLRATHAAAHYLKDLNRLFNNWYLAMAAYNAGEGRIFRAIIKGDTRNFWKLAERKMLPRETMNYVPKYLAAKIIGSNPEKFGFDFPKSESILRDDLELAEVPGMVPLGKVASGANSSLEELRGWNPHLHRGVTPPGRTYKVWVPKSSVTQLASMKSALRSVRVARAAPVRRSGKTYRVRRGETLGGIARRNRMSVSQLKKLNRIRGSRIFIGQRLRVTGKKGRSTSGKRLVSYRVRRGDTLLGIARTHGMKVRDLKRSNGLRSNRIYVGSRLKVRASGRKVTVHRVRRGENLLAIARRYAMSVNRLKGLNGIRRNRIYVGERLKVFKQTGSI